MQGLQSIIELNWGKFLVIALMKLCCWILNFLLMSALGSACTIEQTEGLNHIKDISEGFDVLSLFGKKERFVSGISEGSDGIEKPKFRLNATKGVTYAVVNCANLVCQILAHVWLGWLVFIGVVFPGTMLGTGNIIGRLSSALGNLAAIRLSIIASKPSYFAY